MIGKTIGQYEIREKIGEGGMGEVFLANDTRLHRKVALKFLPPEYAENPERLTRLKQEARSAAALNDPTVCTIFEIGEVDDHTFICMEYVEGSPLDAMIPSGGFPVETVIRLGSQVAQGIAHAHSRQIIHRDLKSANVMVSSSGSAKVLDFGLSRPMTRDKMEDLTQSRLTLTEAGAIAGSLPYLAPELLRGEPADTKSDIWALGVLLFEMVTGDLPFQGQTVYEMTAAILTESLPDLPPGLPNGLAQIIKDCCQRDPVNRIENMDEIQRKLDDLAAEALVTELRREVTTKIRRWLFLAAGVVIIALGLMLRVTVRLNTSRVELLSAEALLLTARSEPNWKIAVFPFTVSGTESQFGEHLARLLDLTLNDAGRIHTENSHVLIPYVLEHIEQQGAIDYSEARSIVEHFGCGKYIRGSIIAIRDSLRISAALFDLEGNRLTEVEVTGIESDFMSITEELARALIRGQFPGSEGQLVDVAAITTKSWDALKAYLEAEAAMRSGGIPNAYTNAFRRVVEIDSTFAIAWWRLAWCVGWTLRENGNQEAIDCLKQAQKFGATLPPRYNTLFKVEIAFRQGQWREAAMLGEQLIQVDRNNTFAWSMLNNIRRWRWCNGEPLDTFMEYLEEKLAIDPTDLSMLHSLAIHEARRGNPARADSLLQIYLGPQYEGINSANVLFKFIQVLATDDMELIQPYLNFYQSNALSPTNCLHLISRPLNTERLDIAELMTDHLSEIETATSSNIPVSHIWKARIFAGQGRWREAVTELAIAEVEYPDAAIAYGAYLASLPFLEVSGEELVKYYEKVVQWDPSTAPTGSSTNEVMFPVQGYQILRHYLAGTLNALLDQREEAERFASELELWTEPEYYPAFAADCARRIQANLAIRAGNNQQALSLLNDVEGNGTPGFIMRSLAAPMVIMTGERIERAKIHEIEGDIKEALRWYDSNPLNPWVESAAPGHLGTARVLEQMGEIKEAIEHYRRFIRLWEKCDPALQPRVQEARLRLEALQVEAKRN